MNRIDEKIDKYLVGEKRSATHNINDVVKAMGGWSKIFKIKTQDELENLIDKTEDILNKKAFKNGASEAGIKPSDAEKIIDKWMENN
jgi:hypothetical protein